MKRLTFLTVIAVATVATSSGCGTCRSLLNSRRGTACNTCEMGSYESYSPPTDAGIIYEGDTMLPPVTGEVLPGPVNTMP